MRHIRFRSLPPFCIPGERGEGYDRDRCQTVLDVQVGCNAGQNADGCIQEHALWSSCKLGEA